MKRIHFNSINSTHTFAKKNLSSLNFPITLICANFQTNGIGTKNSSWIAPKNSSLLTSLIYSTPKHTILPHLSTLYSTSIIHALSHFQLPFILKHPNDILINNKKICGVLTEIYHNKTITSMGLNLFQSTQQLQEINQPATSLSLESPLPINKDLILNKIINHFFSKINQYYKLNKTNEYV